jgi:branched-chain amino acid transport system ATP-binding protein
MASSSQPILQVENLSVCYGVISALRDVSLVVNEGEIVTLVGSNGAGKTTLLRTISGLLKPRSGSITFQGHEVHRLRPDEIVRIGISHSPEGRQVFPSLSVRENLLLGAYQRRDRHAIAADLDRACTLFPILRERHHQKAGTLSGGEQQMLAIARALMARPKLLLLDEPSLGLAPLIVRKIFEIIRELKGPSASGQVNMNEVEERAGGKVGGKAGGGTTIFLVEQNAHMALRVADRAYVLQTGQIVKHDTAANLLADPAVQAAYLGG